MTKTNDALLARDQAHLIHPLHSPSLHESGHVWVKGEGATLTDADGKEYIDGLSGSVERARGSRSQGTRRGCGAANGDP